MQPDNILKNFFTPQQLADELGKSPRTLQRWEALRIGPPATRIGKMILYRRESVEKWLESLEAKRTRRGRRAA